MGFAPVIRPIALGLIRDGSRLFVSEGFDPIKQQTFYRSLGGGIDFGETSLAALHREFQEEMQAELTNVHYLGCLENIFIFNGTAGHELIQLYSCDFVDRSIYSQESIVFKEGHLQKKALWVERDRFLSDELILHPQGIEAFI